MPRATKPNNSETTYDVVESEIKARGLAKSRAHHHRIKSLKETRLFVLTTTYDVDESEIEARGQA